MINNYYNMSRFTQVIGLTLGFFMGFYITDKLLPAPVLKTDPNHDDKYLYKGQNNAKSSISTQIN